MAQSTIELAPGVALFVEEKTSSHWIATSGTLVILSLAAASHSDPSHVHSAAQVVSRALRRGASAVQLLALFSPAITKPPSAEVRRAFLDAAHLGPRIDSAAAVILGEGFSSAIHRGAITGILTLLGFRSTVRVSQSIREGVEHTFRGSETAARALERYCEANIARG